MRKKNNAQYDRKLLLKFFRTYMLILTIPVTCSAIVYGFAFFQLQVNSQQAVRTLLENAAYSTDINIMRYYSELENLVNDQPIQKLIDYDHLERGSSQIADVYNVILNNNHQLNGDPVVFDYHIYSGKNDITISSGNVYLDIDSFYGNAYKWDLHSKEEWYGMISRNIQERYIIPAMDSPPPAREKNASSAQDKVITMIYSLPQTLNSDRQGYAALLLKENELLRLLKSLDIGNGFICVYDYKGNLISSNEIEPIPLAMNADQLRESDGEIVKLNGEKFAITTVKSSMLGWTFAVAMPLMYPTGILKNLLEVFFFSFLFSFVTGVVLAVRHSKKITSPWRLFADEFELSGSERTVEKAAAKVFETVKNHKELCDNQKTFILRMKAGILNELLSPCANWENIKELSDTIDIVLDSPYYCLLYVSICEDDKNICQKVFTTTFESDRNNLVQDIFCGNDHNGFFILVLLNSTDRKMAIEHILEKTMPELKKPCVCVSSVFYELKDAHVIKTALEQVMEENTRKYIGNLDEPNGIVWMTIPESVKNNRFFVPLDFELILLEQIQLTNIIGIKMLFRDIRHSNAKSDMASQILLKGQVSAAVARVLCNVGCETCEIAEITGKISTLPPETSITYACDKVCEMAVLFSETSQDDGLCMIEYVQNNFNDNCLCIEHMKSTFFVSARMIQLTFSQKTGRTFSDYLEWLRLDHACKLLSDNTINVMNIAEAVGYVNDHSFRRAFKRRFDINPGDFRKHIKYFPKALW